MGRRDLIVAIGFAGFGVLLLAAGIWGTFFRTAAQGGVPDSALPDPAAVAGSTRVVVAPVLVPATPAVAGQVERSGQRPSATLTPLPSLVLLDVVVCDATVDCGSDPAQMIWFEVTACLRAAGAGRPLVFVVTGRDAPPTGVEDPWVFARSAPIQGAESLTCHPVRVVGAPLIRRDYWLWVLDDAAVLARRQFTLAR